MNKNRVERFGGKWKLFLVTLFVIIINVLAINWVVTQLQKAVSQ